MKSAIYLILLVILSALALADTQEYYQDSTVNINIPCYENGKPCIELTNCSITIFDPNEAVIISNHNMTRNETYYNYSIKGIYHSQIGLYKGYMNCVTPTASGFSSFSYIIKRKIAQNNILTISRCPLEDSAVFLAGYFLLIALIFCLFLVNEILFKLPLLTFISGISFMFISLPIYSCDKIIGIPLTLFGLFCFVIEINRLRG